MVLTSTSPPWFTKTHQSKHVYKIKHRFERGWHRLHRGTPGSIRQHTTNSLIMKIRAFLPSWRSLPDITHHTLKSLSCVPKRADATIPVSIIGAGLGLPLRPSKKRKQKNKTGQWKLVLLVKSSITPAIKKKNHYKGTRTRDPLGCRLSQIQCMMEKKWAF